MGKAEAQHGAKGNPERDTLWKEIRRGWYPSRRRSGRDIGRWQASYLQTYLERDVRGLRYVGDLGLFQSFADTGPAQRAAPEPHRHGAGHWRCG